jgi:hypothetical protein
VTAADLAEMRKLLDNFEARKGGKE